MSTHILIPGAGGDPWYWHRVVDLLQQAGHRVITPTLPSADPNARLADYVAATLAAAPNVRRPVVVGQSLGGLIAPIVARELDAELLVLVAPMIPSPGESGAEWWTNTGQMEAAAALAAAEGRSGDRAFDPIEMFLHDLPPDVLAMALQRPVTQTEGIFCDPWPLASWPRIPTRVIAGRHDRLFPLAFVQRVARARLGIEPVVIDTGHLPALAAPSVLAATIERLRREVA